MKKSLRLWIGLLCTICLFSSAFAQSAEKPENHPDQAMKMGKVLAGKH